MPNHSILIIEDNSINLKLVQVLLSKEGYTVYTAENAEDALFLLKDTHPTLILMDLQLPGMDGLQLTKLLKSHPETNQIVIVALTAYAMKGDAEKALEAGCDGYIAKPIDTQTFPDLIKKMLENNIKT